MKKTILLLAVIASFTFVFTSCEKDEEEPIKETIETITTNPKDTVRVNYSVSVVPAGTSSLLKSKTAISGAVVTVARDGKLVSDTTDQNGIATFKDLRSGIIAVTIIKDGYTAANLLVDVGNNNLEQESDYRYASTMVGLLPTSGEDMISIQGKAEAQLDVTAELDENATNSTPYTQSPELENVPSGTELLAIVDVNSINSFVSTSGNGKMINVSYEGVMYKGSVDASGNYSIAVPMSYKGIGFSIYPANFQYGIKYSAKQPDGQGGFNMDSQNNYLLSAATEEHIFDATSKEVSVNVKDVFIDFVWTYSGKIEDENYYGTIYK